MSIIIISAFFPPDQNEPEQQLVEEAPAQTEIPEIPKATDQQFYSGVNKLTQEYKTTSDQLRKEDLLNEIYNYPTGTGGTVGGWLSFHYKKNFPNASLEEANQQARVQIWQGIDEEYRNREEGVAQRGRKLAPVTNIIGWLKDQIKLWGRREQSKESDSGDRYSEYAAYVRPYMIGVRDRTDIINKDLLDKVEAGEIKPEQAAWTQFKRNSLNDTVNPQTGKTRIETAKEAFQQEIDNLHAGQINELKSKVQNLIDQSKIDPKISKNFDSLLKDVLKPYPRHIELKSVEPLVVGARLKDESDFNHWNKFLGKPAEFNKKSSPLYLTGPMFDERASPEMLSKMWSELNVEKTTSIDTQSEDSGRQLYDPSTEEGHALPKLQDAGPLTKDRKKTIIEDAPETFLSEFNDDPETMQGIENNLHLIQPYIPARDKAGNIVMDGSRPQTVKNPKFRQNIEGITQSLYGPGSKPRTTTDERGRSRPIHKPTDDRTKEALFLIGQFYANSIDDDRDEHTRLKELERNMAPYVQQPLALQHYDGPPLKGSQQYALAMREVMLDMMKYIGTDHNTEAAQFRKWIRTATFLYINKIMGT